MDLELWAELSIALESVQRQWPPNRRDTHPTPQIVAIHLWSVLHDRPTQWACDPRHWPDDLRPAALPHRSRMGRRLARGDFEECLTRLGRCLNEDAVRVLPLIALRRVDGHALELPVHTTDRDAAWGRGTGHQAIGYKLHVIESGKPMPDAFVITPLDTCEKQMAARLIDRVPGQGGYLLADAHYDASWLHQHCHAAGHRLLAPRPKPGTGRGHRKQSPLRLSCIDMLEPPGGLNRFGRTLHALRVGIERALSGLRCFGGGLQTLPTWVRRAWRVRRWVWAKLLINTTNIQLINN